MPFLLAAIRWKPNTHLDSGILLRSITVPTVTVNGISQSLQWYSPGRWLLPCSSVALVDLQCTHTGPFGQRTSSRCVRAAISSWKMGLVRLTDMDASLTDEAILVDLRSYVKYIIPRRAILKGCAEWRHPFTC